MRIGRNLRTHLGQLTFVRKFKKVNRDSHVINLEHASSVGILYDATDLRNSEIVKNFVRLIRTSNKKDILTLGYIDKAKWPEQHFAQLGFDFFTRKDLNFNMVPVSTGVKNFISEKFDILISLNNNPFPIKYIAAMSCARFKIGRYTGANQGYYDLMISVPGEPTLKNVLEEIENILRLIKPS